MDRIVTDGLGSSTLTSTEAPKPLPLPRVDRANLIALKSPLLTSLCSSHSASSRMSSLASSCICLNCVSSRSLTVSHALDFPTLRFPDFQRKPYTNKNATALRFQIGSSGSSGHSLWGIDFHMQGSDKIDLIFSDPLDSGYVYDDKIDLGFHFQDFDDTWRPIRGVTVSTSFGPKGFDPSLIRFDENNIYVNLKGINLKGWDCVGGSCLHPSSPTGLNNIITLNIHFQGDPRVYRIKEIGSM